MYGVGSKSASVNWNQCDQAVNWCHRSLICATNLVSLSTDLVRGKVDIWWELSLMACTSNVPAVRWTFNGKYMIIYEGCSVSVCNVHIPKWAKSVALARYQC